MQKKFSLRGHKAPVSILCSHNDSLISADSHGWVVWWNVATKRPIALWQAHSGQVLTVKSTPWGLLTHGRDSCIRIWDLTDPAKLNSSLAQIGQEDVVTPQKVEIPVNALNFCNVDVFDDWLVTPSSTDSEKLDIYKLSPPEVKPFSFSRALHSFPNKENFGHAGKREGDGIIMKLRFLNKSLLFVGYESGCIRGYFLKDKSISRIKSDSKGSDHFTSNKDLSIKEVFTDSSHSPQPILSLEFDETTGTLYSGSASKKLLRFNIAGLVQESVSDSMEIPPLLSTKPEPKIVMLSDTINEEAPPELPIQSFNLRHLGIQHIVIDSLLYICFWDGVIKAYDQKMDEAARMERSQEKLHSNFNEDSQTPQNNKAVSIISWKPQLKSDSRLMLRWRKTILVNHLFVGFNDGLISAYKCEN